MEYQTEPIEQEQEAMLDRKQIAVDLRELGIDVDFEDWDGLDDNEVLGNVATLALMYGFDIEEVLKIIAGIEKIGEIEL